MGEWHGQTRWIAEQSMRLFSEQLIPAFDTGARPREPLAVSQ
jgi:hypothetical protein